MCTTKRLQSMWWAWVWSVGGKVVCRREPATPWAAMVPHCTISYSLYCDSFSISMILSVYSDRIMRFPSFSSGSLHFTTLLQHSSVTKLLRFNMMALLALMLSSSLSSLGFLNFILCVWRDLALAQTSFMVSLGSLSKSSMRVSIFSASAAVSMLSVMIFKYSSGCSILTDLTRASAEGINFLMSRVRRSQRFFRVKPLSSQALKISGKEFTMLIFLSFGFIDGMYSRQFSNSSIEMALWWLYTPSSWSSTQGWYWYLSWSDSSHNDEEYTSDLQIISCSFDSRFSPSSSIRWDGMKEDRETWTDSSGWWTRLLRKNSRIKKSWHWRRSSMQPSPEARVPPRISMMGLSCANRRSNKWRNNIMRHRARCKLRNTFLEQILNVAVWSFGRSPVQSSGPCWDWGCPGFASGNSVFAVDRHFKWSNTVISTM